MKISTYRYLRKRKYSDGKYFIIPNGEIMYYVIEDSDKHFVGFYSGDVTEAVLSEGCSFRSRNV